jgi:transposase
MAATARSSAREQHWREVVAQWRQSGLAVHRFCLERGLAETTFYRWRGELERRDGLKVDRREGSKVQFLPVRVTRREVPSRADAGIEVVLANGRCLRVRPGFDRTTLVEVVQLLDEGGAPC